MCQPSIVAPDWIVKGCHIHVNNVELGVFPDHQGRIGFRPVFGALTKEVEDAIRDAVLICLTDPRIREKWINRLDAAQLAMLGESGDLYYLARGRMAEFKFLKIAIRRWSNDNP